MMKRCNYSGYFMAAAIAVILSFCSCGAKDRNEGMGMCIVLAEQSRHYVAIVNVATGQTEWTWDVDASGLLEEHREWFNCPTEIKPVYGGKYILVVSNGGIGLIRISDSRMVWYAASGGGFPHSAEILPDGNIAVACSESGTPAGNKLKLYEVDFGNYPAEEPVAVYPLKSGHNVVWDRKNKVLWATAYTTLNSYEYGIVDGRPALTLKDVIALPEGAEDPHDLFPVYGEQKLWLTTAKCLHKFNPKRKTFEKISLPENLDNLKSVSSGPAGYPVIVLRPSESWWSNIIMDTDGGIVYTGPEYFKIYKCRWMLENTFSYPKYNRIDVNR